MSSNASNGRQRRSMVNAFRTEEDFTNRQILRVVCAASLYVVFATLVLCVFYTYVLNPVRIGNPSLLSFPQDFRYQWEASPELRGALRIWLLSMVGMTSVFAIATGFVLSRKLAGPLHRLKTDLVEMKQGASLFPITLRDGDELQDLTQIINDTLAAVEERSGGAGSRMRSDQAAEEATAAFVSMRAHLETLATTEGEPGLDAWATRMRDLIEKAESSSSAH